MKLHAVWTPIGVCIRGENGQMVADVDDFGSDTLQLARDMAAGPELVRILTQGDGVHRTTIEQLRDVTKTLRRNGYLGAGFRLNELANAIEAVLKAQEETTP